MIRTVLGDRAGAEGHFQCHEHIFLARGRSFEVSSSLLMDDYGASLAELRRYRAAGGAGLVDAQPGGCGRMAIQLERASRESGIAIIASTGFHKLIFYPEDHWIFHFPEDRLADLWISEIEAGMFGRMDDGVPREQLGCRAGIIKVALDTQGLSGRYVSLFEAAASAAKMTGAPVLCHVEAGADPMELVDFLSRRGVGPNRVILCHLDRANPGSAHFAAEAGAFVEFDTIAREKYHSNEAEVRQILRLIRQGHLNKLLLSLDTTNRRLASYGGAIGLDYLLTSFFPYLHDLRAPGLDDAALHQIARVNPGVALSFHKG